MDKHWHDKPIVCYNNCHNCKHGFLQRLFRYKDHLKVGCIFSDCGGSPEYFYERQTNVTEGSP